VIHDPTLSRLCGVDKHVSEVNYADLPRAVEKVPLHFSDGLYFDTRNAKNPYWPTLEVIAYFLPFFIQTIISLYYAKFLV